MPPKRRNKRDGSSDESSTDSAIINHRIERNDNIWQIATQYYGSSLLWWQIRDANPILITRNYQMRANQQLAIPDVTQRLQCIHNEEDLHFDKFYVFSIEDCVEEGDTRQVYIRPPGVFRNNAIVNDLYIADESVDPTSSNIATEAFSITWDAVSLSEIDPTRKNRKQSSNENDKVYQAVFDIRKDALFAAKPQDMLDLREDFRLFRIALEQLERDHQVVSTGAANILETILASNFPMGIQETLYFNYGINNGDNEHSPFIDIKPGMRLGIDSTVMQNDSSDSKLSGTVANGQSTYDVYRQANGSITFNPFTTSIASPVIDETAFASGMVDVQTQGNARQHYRILYPTRLASADNAGSPDSAQNIVLLGADSLNELQTATLEYQNNGIIRTQSRPISVTMFRGRVWMWLEISVYVGGQQVYVPVGTTVQQLMSRYVPHVRHLAQENVFSMSRLHHNLSGFPTYIPVQFEVDNDLDLGVYDLPLLAHDKFDVQWMNL